MEMSQQIAYSNLQERYLAAQERHVAALEDLIRSKDAEIARLTTIIGANKQTMPEKHVEAEDPVPVPAQTPVLESGNAAAADGPAAVAGQYAAWDETGDPIQAFQSVLRHRYAYFSSLAPALKPIVHNAVERYLNNKVGMLLFTVKGKLGVPTSLHVDFLNWIQAEIDGGLLDPAPPAPTAVAVNKRKEGKEEEQEQEQEQETEADGKPVAKKTRKRRNLTPKLVKPVATPDNPPPSGDLKGWTAWTKVVHDRDPSYKSDARGSMFTKSFSEHREIPDYRIAGESGKKTRAIPDKFHDEFFAAIRSKDFYTGSSSAPSAPTITRVGRTVRKPAAKDKTVEVAMEVQSISDDEEAQVPRRAPAAESAVSAELPAVLAAPPGVSAVPAAAVVLAVPGSASMTAVNENPMAQQRHATENQNLPGSAFPAMDVMKWVREQQAENSGKYLV